MSPSKRGTGSVVTWLADDDLYLPDHLETHRRGLGCRRRRSRAGARTHRARGRSPGMDRTRLARFRAPHHGARRHEHLGDGVGVDPSRARRRPRRLGRDDRARPADWDLWKRAWRWAAQPGWSDEVSVLHFRATTRRQAWSLRVAQNTRWFARLTQPEAQAELRDAARLARSTWEGTLTDELRELRRIAEQATTRRDARTRRRPAQRDGQPSSSSMPRQWPASSPRRGCRWCSRAWPPRGRTPGGPGGWLSAELVAARRDQATLQAIYAGGWWRLRGVLRACCASGLSPRPNPLNRAGFSAWCRVGR